MPKTENHIRTIKIEITSLLKDDDIASICQTAKDATHIFDYFVKLGNDKKSTSYMILHHEGYSFAKKVSPKLPTAILQQTAKVALASIKSWNSNVKLINQIRDRKNKLAIKNRWKNYKPKSMVKKWEYKGKRTSPSYPINKLSLSRRGNLTTFSSNNGRIRILHSLPEWFLQRYPNAKLQAGNVIIKDKRIFLNLSFRVNPVKQKQGKEIVGIDRGINNIIATSKGLTISSEHILKIKKKYQTIRGALQQKGTKSAKRHLKRLSGKEKRFMLDVNHCISKQLSNDTSVSTYVLEDLIGIRNQNKGKTFNQLLSNWSYCQFEFLMNYKCSLKGILIVKVIPKNTSRKCSVCKNIHKDSRSGELFHCIFCGHTEHADENASKNIRDDYIEQKGCIQPAYRGNES